MQYDSTIHFGVERFILMDSITQHDSHALTSEKKFTKAPAYLALEAMAQTGGMHFRKCMGFARHAFLLSVQQVPLPNVSTFSGCGTTKAVQTALTDSTAAYDILFTCGEIELSGSFLFGSTKFGDQFSQGTLATHYSELFQWLQNA